MKKRENICLVLTVLIIGMVCSLYFYNQLIHTQIPIHSDDAVSATDLRDIMEMGYERWTLTTWLSPFVWADVLLYWFLGPTELFLQSYFAVKYFICITLTLFLSLYRKEKINWWMVPFFVFLSMPGCFGTASIQSLKFHVWTIAVPLICLVYILIKGDDVIKLKKLDMIVLACFCLYGLCEKDILVIVNCWIPFLIYWVIYFIQEGYVKKYLRFLIIGAGILLLAGRVLLQQMTYSAYGASKFPNIEEMAGNLVVGVEGLLSMLNINLIGNDVLQFNTAIAGIRLLFLLLFIYILASKTYEISHKKIKNMSLIDSILVISVYVIIIAYLFGGKREDAISIRYAAYLYYIFLITLCRTIPEIFRREQFLLRVKKYKINLASVLMGICIIVLLDPVTMTRKENDMDVFAHMIKDTEQLDCGLGAFWSADVVSCLNGYHNEIQPGEWNTEKGGVVPYLTEWDSYRNGNRFYNFFVVEEGRDFGITETKLVGSYGKYIDKYEEGIRTVYLYDYDIRTIPLVITADSRKYLLKNEQVNAQNGKMELQSGGHIMFGNIYVTSGKVQIEINGKFDAGTIQLSTDQDVSARLIDSTKDKCTYEITLPCSYDDFEFRLDNMEKDKAWIKNVIIKRMQNYIEIPGRDQYSGYFTPGYYIFGIEGFNIKESKMEFELNGESIKAEKINNGRERVAYGVSVNVEGELTIKMSLQGDVSDVYYQNEIDVTMNNSNKTIYTFDQGICLSKDKKKAYGPYAELSAGSYRLDIYGNNLSTKNIRFTQNSGMLEYSGVQNLQNDPEHCVYWIDATEDIKEFEVIIEQLGTGKDDTQIYFYEVQKEDDVMAPAVKLRYDYDNENICTSGKRDNDNEFITLKSGNICYGPYINLPVGKYELCIYGKNLTEIGVSLTGQEGEKTIDISEQILREEECIKYTFEIDAPVDNFEVVLDNNSQRITMIEQYTIEKIN